MARRGPGDKAKVPRNGQDGEEGGGQDRISGWIVQINSLFFHNFPSWFSFIFRLFIKVRITHFCLQFTSMSRKAFFPQTLKICNIYCIETPLRPSDIFHLLCPRADSFITRVCGATRLKHITSKDLKANFPAVNITIFFLKGLSTRKVGWFQKEYSCISAKSSLNGQRGAAGDADAPGKSLNEAFVVARRPSDCAFRLCHICWRSSRFRDSLKYPLLCFS